MSVHLFSGYGVFFKITQEEFVALIHRSDIYKKTAIGRKGERLLAVTQFRSAEAAIVG